MDKLKLPEVLKRLKEEGIDITKRTFEFYQRLGLLPKPEKRVGKGGKGVYGYYDPEIINLVKEIYKLKEEGHLLIDIPLVLIDLVINKYKSVLNEWGFSDYHLSEMMGWDPKEEKRKDWESHRSTVKRVLEGTSGPMREKAEKAFDLLVKLSTFDSKFEAKLLNELHWWDSPELIETHALEYIRNEAMPIHSGLLLATTEISNELESTKDEIARDALYKMYTKLAVKKCHLLLLFNKVSARLAEIAGREYRHKTKEQWEESAALVEIFLKALENDLKTFKNKYK